MLLVCDCRSECEVMEKLLMADIAMSKWDYVESLLHLQNAHAKISQIMNSSPSVPSNRIVKLSFLGLKPPAMPVLYTWLKQYKEAIYSKVTELIFTRYIFFLIVNKKRIVYCVSVTPLPSAITKQCLKAHFKKV